MGAFALTAAAHTQDYCGPGATIIEFMIGQIMMPQGGPVSSSSAIALCRIVQLHGCGAPLRSGGPASEAAPLASFRWEPLQWPERKH
jgi:hypothetical protein